MIVEQLDLFDEIKVESEALLNGFYYEEKSRSFISYVLGKRHFVILASRCKSPTWPKEWREKIMRERSI